MSAASGVSNGTGVRVQPAVRGTSAVSGAACHHVWQVRWGLDRRWAHRRRTMTRNGHGDRRWRTAGLRHAVDPPTPTRPPHRPTGLGDAGGCLPRRRRPGPRLPGHRARRSSRASAGQPAGPSQVAFALLVWALALAAGAALLVAGTNRLAAHRRVRPAADTPAGRRSMRVDGRAARRHAWSSAGVVPARRPTDPGARHRAVRGRRRPRARGSRPAPSRRHVVGDADARRLGPDGASARSRRARRRRVRHWLTHGDLDFVVRVYAALVTPDTTIPRSPLCAVISDDQIPDWIAALPRQRSFSAGAPEPPAGAAPRGRGRRGAAARLVGEPGLEPGTSGI